MSASVFGKKLSRDTNQRQALLKGLAGALFRSEAIETTQAKAQASVTLIENLITKARRANLTDIRIIESVIVDKELIHKLVHEIAPRFKNRPGGYLRLIKLGNRQGDNAPMVRIEFTASQIPQTPQTPKKSVKKSK
ncbi:MAG: large subunit ribosomal protein L17 [Microgenomates group bacterium Gr01-1014_16]|nr:MAG: large subunit ribosomal protein L17 [Microgenomates group bacterium Gr01-1014_16]